MESAVATKSIGEMLDYVDGTTAKASLKWFNINLVMFGLGAAGAVGKYAFMYWLYGQMRADVEQYGWGNVPIDELSLVFSVDRAAPFIEYVPLVVYLVAFFIAMGYARRLADALLVHDLEYSYGWTVATLFVPLVNLVRPWVGLAEIRRAVIETERRNIPTSKGATSFATLILDFTMFIGGAGIRAVTSKLDDGAVVASGADFSWIVQKNQGLFVGAGLIQLAIVTVMFIYLVTIRASAGRLIQRYCS